MRRLSTVFVLVLLPFFLSAQMKYSGFDGGMMLHTGYVQGKQITTTDQSGQPLQTITPKGAPFGIGGMAKVHLGKHLRIGAEGYVSNLKYGVKGTFSALGWGGLLADCMWKRGKFTPFIGGTIGGGGYKNMILENNYGDDYVVEDHVSFRHYGLMLITPFVGFEYALTNKVHLSLKLDYIIPVAGRQEDFVTGPRIYFGFMFHRSKTQEE